MIDEFLIKLFLSFIVGSLWITLLSIFSEKFGTKIGGAIASIPATIVVSLFFIGWTQSAKIAAESTTIVPIVTGINTLFIITYMNLKKSNFYIRLSLALALWFLLTISLNLSRFNNFHYSIIGFMILVPFSYYILEKKMNIVSHGKKKVKYTSKEIMIRAMISGITVTFAVVMAKVSGPILGGTFATFPAVGISMIIITQMNHGKDFSHSLLKNFIISGAINVLVFTIAIRYTFPSLGIIYGTLISLIISLITAYLTYNFINKNML